MQEVEPPMISRQSAQKVVRLSALRTGRHYPPGNILGTHLCYRLSRPQRHSAAGRMSMKKIPMGNRTRDLPACNAVPQPTVQIEWYSLSPDFKSKGSFSSPDKRRDCAISYVLTAPSTSLSVHIGHAASSIYFISFYI